MLNLRRIWKTREVRNGILFVFGVLVVFRIAAHIPVPGVDATSLASFFQSSQFFGLLNVFSGGTLENFSIVALGVAPYITASIIFQLLAMIIPSLEEMQKEEQGRQRINQWTRLAAVPLSLLQAYGMFILLRQQGQNIMADPSLFNMILAMVTMSAGTIFLMWLGELISEKHVGNGISIVIFAGIIAGLPSFVRQAIAVYDRSQLVTIILFAIGIIIAIVSIVIMNEAQRNIPIQYARQVRGSRLAGGVSTHLPLRVNMGGMIPVIFAISIILFPSVLAQFLLQAQTPWVRQAATTTLQLMGNQYVYIGLFFLLVFGFTFFYTAVIFHPDRVAENLQKQGGFIPGIRPGRPTAEYLGWVTNRILLFGALFLALIGILPNATQLLTGTQNLAIQGVSIIIIVSVLIDSLKQIEGQMSMREYDY